LPAKSGKNANSMEYETKELGIGALAEGGAEILTARGAAARPLTAAAEAQGKRIESKRNIDILGSLLMELAPSGTADEGSPFDEIEMKRKRR
jgi:hypothetical protein